MKRTYAVVVLVDVSGGSELDFKSFSIDIKNRGPHLDYVTAGSVPGRHYFYSAKTQKGAIRVSLVKSKSKAKNGKKV